MAYVETHQNRVVEVKRIYCSKIKSKPHRRSNIGSAQPLDQQDKKLNEENKLSTDQIIKHIIHTVAALQVITSLFSLKLNNSRRHVLLLTKPTL